MLGESRANRRRPATMPGLSHFTLALLLLLLYSINVDCVILTPPYFNLAEGRNITASATCGVDTEGPELYCKLVGANAENDEHVNVIQGQVCDYCDPKRNDKMHPPEFAVDGMETWWQSPPLSRGMKYNEVNLTIDLGQEFHVAYVYLRMGNSPRPGLWVLEKSSDYGKTYTPWQYFSDSTADCENFFGKESLQPITRDDSVICSTEYSKIVPLEGGEIPISLLNNRPSANHYFNSSVLQEWTRATNVRLRLLRTKNLLGHLMSVARQDPTVTRRYFYSIKDISIGGRCMCNGHADTCDIQDPQDPKKLLCRCQHNTCGPQCATCCPGFEQKAWRISKASHKFECEPCNCFNHTSECKYDAEIDQKHLSLDIHNNYEGGGVCQNCQHNTEGINCNRCKATYYRPFNKQWNDIDVCQPCNCHRNNLTGNCAEGSGQCECRPEFTPPNCDSCSFGYFDFPNCKPCECNLNGTRGYQCEADGGQCPCKSNYGGVYCDKCADTFYKFPECLSCKCNSTGSLSDSCNQETGNCTCKSSYRGRTCDECEHGYYKYPTCSYCNCDVSGTLPGICDKTNGKCLCREGYGGDRCDQCIPGYYGHPECQPCNCSDVGASSTVCDVNGKCPCLHNFAGRACDQCNPGYYKYPECQACNCDSHGAMGITCDGEGKCNCHHNFDNNRCDQCKEGYYNFPNCEDCNCNPAGVVAAFAGCGSVPAGELCQCKERVHGRICDKCRPLFWNLQVNNPEGCEKCECHLPGVAGGIAVCDTGSGQCVCKPSVVSRTCSECADGTYNLQADDLFGCKDCDCDIGGSINGICDKNTGQCQCQARINGRTCRYPLQAHYFPTLYQFQYELEDGRTPENTKVRFGFDPEVFPNYSWKGYAVFSFLQNEIIQDVYIQKPSVYRMVLSYVNPNNETINGVISIIPDNPSDIEQKFEVQFKPAKTPSFVTVAGPLGNTPSPLVMNPGRWAVSIKNGKNLFLDYFVLLPAAFYEATILAQKVETPCRIGEKGLCRHYSYPNIQQFDVVHGGFKTSEDDREQLTEYFNNQTRLAELGESQLPLLNANQPEIHLDITIAKLGRYVLLVTYATDDKDKAQIVTVHSSSQNDRDHGLATLPSCPYTTLCRQAVTDRQHRIAVFNFDSNFIRLVLKGDENTNVGIKSVVAIPYEQWSLDYIRPKSVCVRKDGKCVQTNYPIAPDSKKVKFEQGNEAQISLVRPPNMYDNSSNLIFLDHKNVMVDVNSKVPHPGYYVFVVQYFQPNFPEFDIDVIIHNGQFYEAKLLVEHCPSNAGCRAIIRQEDGNTRFSLTENFMLSLKEPDHKSVWLEYLLVIPAEEYMENILSEEDFDQTGEFITSCGHNHFYINQTAGKFCRDAVFSLTADYNNGALPCQCDFAGSQSFECEKFGGQCSCKPNVIGRQCEACKTGYYGFPDCKPCNCPSTATCEAHTGMCICPDRVTGEKCDQCIPYTYGFDFIIGCEECNCNPLGVLNDLQCDLLNGSCACKPNIVGRTCDRCQAGHYAFPYCERCRCDLRGTTQDICDQQNAECYCKQNVRGPECDFCVEGTFNLQETNEDGCTKCFCFGKTPRCSSSHYFRTEIGGMQNWTLLSIIEGTNMTINLLESEIIQLNSSVIGADLTVEEADEETVYFSAPLPYLGNKLTSYGGFLNYTIFYTISGSGSAVSGADVILYGADMYLLHPALEQPPPNVDYSSSVEMVEANFDLANGLPANREHLMLVLEDLRGIYIRATYWNSGVTTRLSEVSLEIAVPSPSPSGVAVVAVAVEQCQCPPNYSGLSCEECASGSYRVPGGPHGGYCVKCQCNGHSDQCDVHTGICIACKHNTRGDHCEMCDIGYHGNALQGTPMDCLICACPLPIASNNFATGCEVSSDGEHISCDCLPGYYGARCHSCAAGYFGQPEVMGETCKLCECSGNIDSNEIGSCDSVSGECLRCLNNTFGEACALCAPGYFGDAVVLKDCQSCICDELGTHRCDHTTGQCECRPNVVGEKCDRCLEDHFGFTSGQGCTPCSCHEASESAQCDDATGQCRCRSGVTARTCDRCAPGFWDYTPEGCVPCSCNTEYSHGFGCNATTGKCECLQGVEGDKCDHCPHRWVLVLHEGCFECDSCTHDLLDVTDSLRELIDPVIFEFDAHASGYFTSRRLIYINNTIAEFKPQVEQLDPNRPDVLAPILARLEPAEVESKNFNRRGNYSAENSKKVAPDADALRKEALEVLGKIKRAALMANSTVYDIDNLRFGNGEGPQIDQALLEAEYIVKEIKNYNFSDREDEAHIQLDKAYELLEDMHEFRVPISNQTDEWKRIQKDVKDFTSKLDDLANYTSYANNKVDDANTQNANYRENVVSGKVDTIEQHSDDANADLEQSRIYLTNATKFLLDAHRSANKLSDGAKQFDQLMKEFNDTLMLPEENDELNNLVDEAMGHSEQLSQQAQLLDHLLSDTRNISENAVDAANAYKNIVNATESARNAADQALAAAEETNNLLDGLEDRSIESKEKANQLLTEADAALHQAQTELKPQLQVAGTEVDKIEVLNNRSENEYKKIIDALNRLGDKNLADLSQDAVDISEDADNKAQGALESISEIKDSIEEDLQQARQMPKNIDSIQRNMAQTEIQLNSINTVLPNITNLINELGPKQASLKDSVNDMEDKIKKANQMIALARELTNKVKLGVRFYPNTTLKLRNPPNLADQSTATHFSSYFRTDKPNGFLLYLGNEKGTQLRKTKSDDYMALEIENGYPVLTVDVGNGPERIISNKYVADGNWYQAVVDRTGPNVKLTIREEVEGGRVVDHTTENVLPGPLTIFNLNQNQSVLFVGGYNNSFDMPEQVQHSSFDGEIEEVMIGDRYVSLWNFQDGEENNHGAILRDKLVNLQPFTGYRFNGNGYAILDARPHSLRARTEIRFNFKTSAPNGLMFLAGKNDTFMSIELRDGKVMFQYELGNGLVTIQSLEPFNDGNWHTVEASRDGIQGFLQIDRQAGYKGQALGPSRTVQVSDTMFFGGYPNQHSFKPVTNVDFDGCIDEVQIVSTPVDLSQNVKTYGVQPGCPAKFATLVSFSDKASGYIRHPNISSSNSFQVSLKFKTEAPDGLIFYATDQYQSAGVSLALVNKALVLISQKTELMSGSSTKYNDNEWHVVTVTHNGDELRMDIDDWDFLTMDAPPPPLHIMYGDMYIGGLPSHYRAVKGAVRTMTPFTGCIGDATANGMIINFANATDKHGDILGKCILDKVPDDFADLHEIPILTRGPDTSYDKTRTTTEEPFVLRTDYPKRGDGGVEIDVDEGEPETEGPLPLPKTTVRPLYREPLAPITEPQEVTTEHEDGEMETEPPPIHEVDEITPTRPAPTTVESCVLPLDPVDDVSFKAGYRFGTQLGSRLEYDQSRGRYKNKYDFSIDFKTTSPDGVIFYVSDHEHAHFVALHMVDGKLRYLFNCGSGPAILDSDQSYNDGLWHTVVFSRNQTDGKLVVGDRLVAEGRSTGNTKTLNIAPPYYLGGVPTEMSTDVKVNLNLQKPYSAFTGCLNNFLMNGKPMEHPRTEGVVSCSENTESGTFFGAAGGYMKLMERFKVGIEIDIQMSIKPRNVSGLLMSVHGKRDFLVLQMVDGDIKFSVDNGKGPIEAVYRPKTRHSFCDGNWHHVQAVKSKNVVSLSVDKILAESGVGISHSTDTRFPLFLGGHQYMKTKRIRGIQTRNSFVGCIKDVMLNNKPMILKPEMASDNVMVGACPTN